MTSTLARRVSSLGAAIVAASIGAIVLTPASAQAGGCSAIKPCGSVNNNSRFAMHYTLKWKSGPDKCARWTGGGTPEVLACDQDYLAPFGQYGGRTTVNGTTTYIDVDAFTYNSTDFYWNNTWVKKGQWIRMSGGGPRKCTAEIGALPRCN